MHTPIDLLNITEDRIVYVRAVDPSELPKEVRAEAGELGDLYAVHAADGERLAVVAGRDLAFSVARQNDFDPVTVH